MFKWLAKKFMPGGKTLAGYAADGIAKSVNESGADTRAQVARYATFAREATSIANRLAAMVDDGNMSEFERDELAKMLAPMFDKLEGLL
jgi:hypothetical protein